MDAAHFLQVYDTDLIYSWTPREFKNFIKGAQLRQVDAFELSAVSAIFNAKVKNAKTRIKLKDIYNSEAARKEIESDGKAQAPTLNLDRYRKAQEAMKNFRAMALEKGG